MCSYHSSVLAIMGLKAQKGGKWIVDQPDRRNLTDSEDGILTGKRYMIHDRGPLFTAELLKIVF